MYQNHVTFWSQIHSSDWHWNFLCSPHATSHFINKTSNFHVCEILFWNNFVPNDMHIPNVKKGQYLICECNALCTICVICGDDLWVIFILSFIWEHSPISTNLRHMLFSANARRQIRVVVSRLTSQVVGKSHERQKYSAFVQNYFTCRLSTYLMLSIHNGYDLKSLWRLHDTNPYYQFH